MHSLLPYLRLPAGITSFEVDYLKRMNRIGVGFFFLHLPIFVLIAWLNDTGPLLAAGLTALALVGPVLAWRTLSCPRHVSMVHGFTAMCMGGLLVHFGQGPMQIEMHFYFFSMLAVLAMFANPAVILTAAVTVTVHHLALWWLLPESIFNYDASFWVVLVHAAFVVLESVAACFISRSFFDNVIGLEKIVAARTQALNARNEDMHRLLNSVDQGFFTLDSTGAISSERSTIVDQWLGPVGEDTPMWEALANVDPSVAEWFTLGWEEVVADLMPVELSLSQLPDTLVCADGLHLKMEYTPLFAPDGETLDRVMVVITDMTAEIARISLEARQREILVVFEKILSDKQGFLEFFAEADDIIDAIRGGRYASAAEARRLLHTIKGNAAIFGLQTFSDSCHELESAIDGDGQPPTVEQRAALSSEWVLVRADLKRLLGDRQRNGIEIQDNQYESILEAVLANRPYAEIARMIALWRLEPTAVRLDRIAQQASGIAGRLGKPGLKVVVHDEGQHLDPGSWSRFWGAFVHVIRNAVDHGIETPDVREAAGKPAAGTLRMRTAIEGERFLIEIADDGKGIDWDALRRKAEASGLPHETHADLVAALLTDGVSSRDEVTAVSGRGVGMAAVRQACEEKGGAIEVISERGVGTRFQFWFPVSVAVPPLLRAA